MLEEFPIHVLIKIFSYLDRHTLLTVVRYVCKRFNSIIVTKKCYKYMEDIFDLLDYVYLNDHFYIRKAYIPKKVINPFHGVAVYDHNTIYTFYNDQFHITEFKKDQVSSQTTTTIPFCAHSIHSNGQTWIGGENNIAIWNRSFQVFPAPYKCYTILDSMTDNTLYAYSNRLLTFCDSRVGCVEHTSFPYIHSMSCYNDYICCCDDSYIYIYNVRNKKLEKYKTIYYCKSVSLSDHIYSSGSGCIVKYTWVNGIKVQRITTTSKSSSGALMNTDNSLIYLSQDALSLYDYDLKLQNICNIHIDFPIINTSFRNGVIAIFGDELNVITPYINLSTYGEL